MNEITKPYSNLNSIGLLNAVTLRPNFSTTNSINNKTITNFNNELFYQPMIDSKVLSINKLNNNNQNLLLEYIENKKHQEKQLQIQNNILLLSLLKNNNNNIYENDNKLYNNSNIIIDDNTLNSGLMQHGLQNLQQDMRNRNISLLNYKINYNNVQPIVGLIPPNSNHLYNQIKSD